MNIKNVNPFLWKLFVENGYTVPTNVYMNGWEYNILKYYQDEIYKR